ncbi:MAG TPA: glycosyltransferase family 4 protein [Candidatus Eisenbacteria bacterium]|nr:glycosyltransferase family 4 protein [Candidatus Eisenbacteria bacterium]
MKVLLVAGVDLSLPGGLETHVLELARGLTARGHDLTVFARASRGAPDPALRLVDRFDAAGADIVHHHGGPWAREWDDAIDPKQTAGRARYLRTFHFSVAAKMAVYLRMRRIRTLFNPGNHRALHEERTSLARGPLHIAVSRALRDELVRYHGAPRELFEAIPNGASFAPPRAGRAAWRERHAIPPDARVLLTIGRDDYVKGFDLLARAWSASDARPSGALWVTVGGARPSREGDRIATGPIAPADVIEWIHAADVGAFPSYYEGGGIALTDMLAGGLYVLSHAVGVAPEAIRPGENGEFVPRRPDAWRAALARTLASPPRPPAPGLAPDWGWDVMAERVERVYKRLRPEIA